MKTVLFIDNTYPQPYQLSSLLARAIGGTESSIINTAAILSQRYRVFVAQKYRHETCQESASLSFISKANIKRLRPDYIVVLRKYPLLKKLYKQFPKAKLYLWLHTYKNTEYVFKRIGLASTNTTIICNSNTHKQNTSGLLNMGLLAKFMSFFAQTTKVEYCYNPVTQPLVSNVKKDINKLLFFSSPNKGLGQILKCFKTINKKLPSLKLYIANPGYKADGELANKHNIINLGKLAHQELMQHLASSLCVFYPQDSFAETFGLIYAEANALGVPVLAHDIGAAREILHANNQLIDAQNYSQIIATIVKWQQQIPKIEYSQKFNNENVLTQWCKVFALKS